MFSFKWLNSLLLLENFFGIYRTYSEQKYRKKCFILFQIFIQSMMNTISMTYQVYVFFGRNKIDQLKLMTAFFSVSTNIGYILSIVTAIYYNRNFISYLRSISSVYEYFFGKFKNFSTLIKSIKRVVYPSISFTLLTFFFSGYRSTQIFIHSFLSDPVIILLPVLLSHILLRVNIVLQHLMLYVVIMIVVLLIKCLNMFILDAQERVESNDSNSDKQCVITRMQIQEWVEQYQDLAKCCEKVMKCFGHQYFYSLAISLTQIVLVAYQVLYLCLSKAEITINSARVIILCSYIAVGVMPLVAAQLTRNQGAKLHRVLVRLYNKMIIGSGEAEAKLIKDFIRLIKKNPLEIKFLSKISAGVYMLPIVLTLGVNYVIVMLQFNHVI